MCRSRGREGPSPCGKIQSTAATSPGSGTCWASAGSAMPRRPPRGLPLLSPLLILAVWEALARARLIDVRFFPAPTAILAAAWGTAQSGELWADLGIGLDGVGGG